MTGKLKLTIVCTLFVATTLAACGGGGGYGGDGDGGGGYGGGSEKAWATAELIETDAGDAFNPQIAFDTSGNVLAVWEQSDGTRTNIRSNRYTAGLGWGTAEFIETDNVGSAVTPQIAIAPNGNALAVWSQFDGTRTNIWANRFQ